MKTQIIILILITNIAIGQKKVTIDPNVVKYETKDEFNRFDDIANDLKQYNSFEIEITENSNLKIINRYSSGFTGQNIFIVIDKKLNIIKAGYDYWTDVPETGTEYKVESIDLKLNQNPFKNTNGLRGQYEMQIEKVTSDGKLIKQNIFKGKFKSFKGIDKSSP